MTFPITDNIFVSVLLTVVVVAQLTMAEYIWIDIINPDPTDVDAVNFAKNQVSVIRNVSKCNEADLTFASKPESEPPDLYAMAYIAKNCAGGLKEPLDKSCDVTVTPSYPTEGAADKVNFAMTAIDCRVWEPYHLKWP